MVINRKSSIMAGAIILSGVLVPGAAPAADVVRYGLSVYSDFCISPYSGDVSGHRISLLRYSDNDKLIYEYSEGAVMWPLFAGKQHLDLQTGALTFEVSNEGQTTVFSGTLTSDALTGTLSDERTPVRLPRVKDLGRKMPPCS